MWRVIDIGGSGYYLHSSHSKLEIEKDGTVMEAVPYSDIHSVIIHSENLLVSNSVFTECADNKIPIVFCDKKHLPSGIFLSYLQHNESGKRLKVQIEASVPKQKRAWQMIVKAKIKAQSTVLEKTGFLKEKTELEKMSDTVLSGDSTNREAVAAKLYFETLFSTNFSRRDENDSINGLLDYGYTIIRSSVARAIVSAGLNPSISIFHSHQINPFALADDLMEPIRPIVDLKVISLINKNFNELNPSCKKELISLISERVVFNDKNEELSHALQLYCLSYLNYLSGNASEINFPVIFEE